MPRRTRKKSGGKFKTRILDLVKTLGETPAKKVGADIKKDANSLCASPVMHGGAANAHESVVAKLATSYTKDLVDSIQDINAGLAKIDNHMKTVMDDLATTASGKAERLAIFDDAVAVATSKYEVFIDKLKKKTPKTDEIKAVLANIEGAYASFLAEAPLERKLIEMTPEIHRVGWWVSFAIKLGYTLTIIGSLVIAAGTVGTVAESIGLVAYDFVANPSISGAVIDSLASVLLGLLGVVALAISNFTFNIGMTTRDAFFKYKGEPVPDTYYNSFISETLVWSRLGVFGLYDK
jgi:hypothetical protein